MEVAGRRLDGVTVVVQNADPYTYFGSRPIRISEGSLSNGTLGLTVLKRATPMELPTVLWRAFSGKAETVARHRQIEGFPGITEARVVASGGMPFPVQVDGDFLGEFDSVEYAVRPDHLTVVS